MLEHYSPRKRNSIYIAIAVGVFWTLSSFLPLPQMTVLYLLDGIAEMLNIQAATTKNIIYAVIVVICAIAFNRIHSKTGMVLSAIILSFCMTPLFAYYDNFIPQKPYFLPGFLCGLTTTVVLCISGLLKKSKIDT